MMNSDCLLTPQIRHPFFVTRPAVLVYTRDMKSALLFPFILLFGLIIGGWAPNEELRAVKREVAELKKRPADSGKESRIDLFTRMVQIPDRAKTASLRPRPAATNTPSTSSPTGTPAASSPPPPLPITNSHALTPRPPTTPEDLRARIDEAKELWKTRVEIARAQWLGRLKLSPEETALFDDTLNTMNANLYASMQELADRLASGEALTPETGTRTFNEISDTLVQSYDSLGSLVPEAQRGEVSQLELTDFIDPAVAEPLIAVQDKLQNLPQPGRRQTPRAP